MSNIITDILKTAGAELTRLSSDGTAKRKQTSYYPQIIDRTIHQTRKDVRDWRNAVNLAKQAEFPQRYPLINMFENDILSDAHLTSQIENRKNAAIAAEFELKKSDGNVDEELTRALQNEKWLNDLIYAVLDTHYYGYTLAELGYSDNGDPCVDIIPRQNLEPKNGYLYFDYFNTAQKILYRKVPEYGTWLLEFGSYKNLGLLNKAVPHVLFKKFALSCWSELCEIYGIPPRYVKTNTQDPKALERSKKMMEAMGAAAWFVIDTTEEFNFAQGVSTNGDVYNNLKNACNNEMSLLVSGAVIGQDTVHGSNNKDQSAQQVLDKLVVFDCSIVEQAMKTIIMPALQRIGWIPEGYSFEYLKAKDTKELWARVKDSLSFYDYDLEWLNATFGLKITGARQTAQPAFGNEGELSAENFFV